MISYRVSVSTFPFSNKRHEPRPKRSLAIKSAETLRQTQINIALKMRKCKKSADNISELIFSEFFCNRACIFRGMDGFIIVDALHSSSILRLLADGRIPHVAFETHLEHPGVNTVMADDDQAVENCVETLWRAGHRDIAFLGGELKAESLNTGIRRRTKAFERACSKLGIFKRYRFFNFEEYPAAANNFTELWAFRGRREIHPFWSCSRDVGRKKAETLAIRQ
jgi:hypothetical protein